MIELTENEIDLAGILAQVQSDGCGAAVLFVGSTRQFTHGRETVELTYECYHELAMKTLGELEAEARNKWTIENCLIVHRLGQVPIGQSSVAIAVASPHRNDAFEAARWLIDTLKIRVPIWKQEHWVGGRKEWIHPVESESSSACRTEQSLARGGESSNAP